MGKNSAAAAMLIFCGPLVVGLPFAVLGTYASVAPLGFACFTIALYALGASLFLLAKTSLLRRGALVSFGSARMSPWNRRAYRAGYTLMMLGCLATALLLEAPGS